MPRVSGSLIKACTATNTYQKHYLYHELCHRDCTSSLPINVIWFTAVEFEDQTYYNEFHQASEARKSTDHS